jgi:hypothetical protein
MQGKLSKTGLTRGKIMENVIKRELAISHEMRHHFEEQVQVLSVEDGRAIGLRIMYPEESSSRLNFSRSRWKYVRGVVERHVGLNEIMKEHPWIVDLLEEVSKVNAHTVHSQMRLADSSSSSRAPTAGPALVQRADNHQARLHHPKGGPDDRSQLAAKHPPTQGC